MTRLRDWICGIFLLLLLAVHIMTTAVILENTAYADEKPEIFIQTGHPSGVNALAVSPDGNRILSGSGDKTLKLWDIATGREIRTFLGHKGGVKATAFSPDGRQAVSGGWDHDIRIWDVATGKEIKTFPGDSIIHSVAVSPDGKYILSGNDDNTVRLWQVSLSRSIRTFVGHKGGVNAVAFSPDGKYVLSGSGDGPGGANSDGHVQDPRAGAWGGL